MSGADRGAVVLDLGRRICKCVHLPRSVARRFETARGYALTIDETRELLS